jgi:hypothetical protein
MKNTFIYSDALVDVNDNGIYLKNYYFPLTKAKLLKFSDIIQIEKKIPTLMSGKWRYWGTGDFKIWFPLDLNRSKRDCILFIQLASQRIRVGFTVENTNAFIEAIQAKGIKIERP